MIGSHRVRIALVWTLVACSRSHAGNVLDIRDPSSDGRNDAGEGPDAPHTGEASIDAGASAQTDTMQPDTVQSDATLTVLDNPPVDGREVFVGQLWALEQDIVLCSPDMPWASTKIVTDPMGYVETTTLILEHVGDPDFGGSIRFGEGEAPTDPGEAPFSNGDSGSYWLCSNQIPTRGVEYAFHDGKQYADRLTFSIIPGEVWNAWCTNQTSPCGARKCGHEPICQCTQDGCTSLPPEAAPPGSGIRLLNFNLAITADTIEGQLPLGSGVGTPADLRLQRKR